MPGNYTHDQVADNAVLTAAIYNDRHQNHINFCTPEGVDDYSSSITVMQQSTNPGTVGAESLATDFSGELARIRFALSRLTGEALWYETQSNVATIGGNQTLLSSDFGSSALRRITNNAALTLPAASAVPATVRLIIKNTGAYLVTITRVSTDTIDGLTTYRIPHYGSIELISNGTDAFFLIENPYRASGNLTLTDGANIAWDHHTQPNGQVTLAGNRTLDNPSNARDGTTHSLLVIQDATGGRTLAYGSNYRWPLNTAPVLSTGKTITGTVTMTIASPAVVTKTTHGLTAGRVVRFTTTGALPTGITAGERYYVISAGLTADDFQISASSGGAAINTSGSQSGTHTVTSEISDVLSFITIGGLHYGVAGFNLG
jgi:hypothetical protein